MNTKKSVFVYNCCKNNKTTDIVNGSFFRANADIVNIDFEWANIDNVPTIVKTAYENKNEKFVCEYLGLKKVFDFGGIFVTNEIEFLENFNSLFESNCFFCLDFDWKISEKIFGATKGCSILKEVLDTYSDNSTIYKDQFAVSLTERIWDIVKYNYGSTEIFSHYTYKDTYEVFTSFELLFDAYYKRISQLANHKLEESEILSLVAKTTIQKLQEENNHLNQEIANIKNSFSWKITKPVRFAKRLLKKILRRG